MAASLWDRLLGPFRRGTPPPAERGMGFYTDTTVCIGCKACEVACKQWNQLPADGLEWTGNSHDNTKELSATSWRHVKFIEQFEGTGVSGAGERKPPEYVESGASDKSRRVALPLSPDSTYSGGLRPPAPLAPDLAPLTPGRWLMMSDVCKHCDTAPCQQACPTGAIVYNEFANVYIQPDICNGCTYCVAACPFGVITRSRFDGLTHKCTLCYDRQKDGLVPACAKACPTESIQFGPLDELRERARKRVEELKGRGVPQAHLYGDAGTESYSALNSFYLLADRPEVYGLPAKPVNPWLNMAGDYARAALGILAPLAVLLLLFLLARG